MMRRMITVLSLLIAMQAGAAWNGYPWAQDADSNNTRLVYGKYDIPEQLMQGTIERWTNMPNFSSHADLKWTVSASVRTGWTDNVVTSGGWVYTNKIAAYQNFTFTNSYTNWVVVVDGVARTSYFPIGKFDKFEEDWLDYHLAFILGPDGGIDYRWFIDADAGAPDNMNDLWWGRTNSIGGYPSGSELPCVCMGNARSNAGDVTVGGWTNDEYGRQISFETLPTTKPWIDLTDYDTRVKLLNQCKYTMPFLGTWGTGAVWYGSSTNWADAVYNASTSTPTFHETSTYFDATWSRIMILGQFWPPNDPNGLYYVTARSYWVTVSNYPPSVEKITSYAYYVQAKNANWTITNDVNCEFTANGDPWGASDRLAKMTFWKNSASTFEIIGDPTLAFPAWAEPAEPETNGVAKWKGYTLMNAVRICTYDFNYD